MKITIIILLIAFLLGLIFILSGKKGSYVVLSGSEFMRQYNQSSDAQLIDVRTPEEYNASHIQGAINIDFRNPSFATVIDKLPRDKEYYIYCHSGNRSGQAVSLMSKMGFTKIFDLKGGASSNPELFEN